MEFLFLPTKRPPTVTNEEKRLFSQTRDESSRWAPVVLRNQFSTRENNGTVGKTISLVLGICETLSAYNVFLSEYFVWISCLRGSEDDITCSWRHSERPYRHLIHTLQTNPRDPKRLRNIRLLSWSLKVVAICFKMLLFCFFFCFFLFFFIFLWKNSILNEHIFLWLYSETKKMTSRISRRPRAIVRDDGPCSKRPMTVHVRKHLNMNDVLIPRTFESFRCGGECTFPLDKSVSSHF